MAIRKLTKAQVDDLQNKLEAHVDDMVNEIKLMLINEVRETLSMWMNHEVDDDYFKDKQDVDNQDVVIL